MKIIAFFISIVGATVSIFAQTGVLELPLSNPREIYRHDFVYIIRGESSQAVMGGQSPFGSEENLRTLHVVHEEILPEKRFEFYGRLWEGGAAPSKGAVEAHFRLVKGSLRFRAGVASGFATNQMKFTDARAQVYCGLKFETGKSPEMAFGESSKMRPVEVDPIEADTNFVVKIEWDFASEENQFFRVLINGQSALSGNHESQWQPSAHMLERGGIDTVEIVSSAESDYFIGPIRFEDK